MLFAVLRCRAKKKGFAADAHELLLLLESEDHMITGISAFRRAAKQEKLHQHEKQEEHERQEKQQFGNMLQQDQPHLGVEPEQDAPECQQFRQHRRLVAALKKMTFTEILGLTVRGGRAPLATEEQAEGGASVRAALARLRSRVQFVDTS